MPRAIRLADWPAAAFNFALAGGTSSGTFGTVSVTATPGNYTALFTGITAGTASTLTIKVNGVTLSSMPSVHVIAGAISGTNSGISFAMPTVALGSTDLVTIAVKDSNGNPITGLPASAFSFKLAGGKSAGNFGGVSAATTPGSYTVVFTGTKIGTASTLTATVNGVTLTARPTVQVVSRKISKVKSAIRFVTPTVVSGSTVLVTIEVKNMNGNPITGLPSTVFRFTLAGGRSAGMFGSVSATATPGTYALIFTGTKAGSGSRLAAKVSGIRLNTEPKVRVIADTVSDDKPAKLRHADGKTSLA